MSRGEKFKRILLKLSGEALGMPMASPSVDSAGSQQKASGPLCPETLSFVADQVAQTLKAGVQVGMVIGGGNIFRGAELVGAMAMQRSAADSMGMLSTVMNAIAMADALEKKGVRACLMTQNHLERIALPYDREQAVTRMESGQVVIFAGGLGMPYFTTDTAAAHRAVDTGCQVLMKATKVDGVYSADPRKDPSAIRFDSITYDQVLERRLGVMDLTAVTLCRENGLALLVLDMMKSGGILAASMGEPIGTLVSGGA